MKNIFILILLSIITLATACKKDPSLSADYELKERFHGKYKLIEAISDQPLDVNQDGKASQDMLSEIPNLQNSHLELRFIDRSSTGGNLFALFWPEQYLSYEADPDNPFAAYANQSYPHGFEINAERTEITTIILPGMTAKDKERWTVPQTLQVLQDDLIRTTITKKLYTRDGFKDVTIRLHYERWTSET